AIFRYLQQRFFVLIHVRELGLQGFDCLGSPTVGANSKWIVVPHLHEVGGFVEDVGNGLVVEQGHGEILNPEQKTSNTEERSNLEKKKLGLVFTKGTTFRTRQSNLIRHPCSSISSYPLCWKVLRRSDKKRSQAARPACMSSASATGAAGSAPKLDSSAVWSAATKNKDPAGSGSGTQSG